jgi:hypothetical protein
MFQLQQSHNQQDVKVYVVSFACITREKLAVEWFQNVSRVMGCDTNSKNGKIIQSQILKLMNKNLIIFPNMLK